MNSPTLCGCGCGEENAYGKSYLRGHNTRGKHIVRAPYRTLEDRFWEKVDKDGPIQRPELTPCWNWIGNLRDGRYGRITSSHGQKGLSTHRVSWELHFGTIPPGAYVCHHCDNPLCVRPDHLYLGTPLSNMQDKELRGRGVYGHPGMFGETSPNHKLTAEQVIAMRTERLTGITFRALAAKYGVSTATVLRIVQRKTWQHL